MRVLAAMRLIRKSVLLEGGNVREGSSDMAERLRAGTEEAARPGTAGCRLMLDCKRYYRSYLS